MYITVCAVSTAESSYLLSNAFCLVSSRLVVYRWERLCFAKHLDTQTPRYLDYLPNLRQAFLYLPRSLTNAKHLYVR